MSYSIDGSFDPDNLLFAAPLQDDFVAVVDGGVTVVVDTAPDTAPVVVGKSLGGVSILSLVSWIGFWGEVSITVESSEVSDPLAFNFSEDTSIISCPRYLIKLKKIKMKNHLWML